jgi:hypothetical protein
MERGFGEGPEIVLVLISLLHYILPHYSSPLTPRRCGSARRGILSIDTEQFQEALCALLH